MKLWVDAVRPAPDESYEWCKSVDEAMQYIINFENEVDICKELGIINPWYYEVTIDIDRDTGDYIKLLEWLEETGRNYPIRIHSMNPVGVENMRRIIQKNGWTEVK